MRDPARIDRILSTLKFVWQENPDLRLAQLIYNAINIEADNYYGSEYLYNIEDTELEKELDVWANQIEKRK